MSNEPIFDLQGKLNKAEAFGEPMFDLVGKLAPILDIWGLAGKLMAVEFCIDFSNSMNDGNPNRFYTPDEDGIYPMQKFLSYIVGLCILLDDDGKLPCTGFSDKLIKLPDVTEENYETYIADVLKTIKLNGTDYSVALEVIHQKVFGTTQLQTQPIKGTTSIKKSSRPKGRWKILKPWTWFKKSKLEEQSNPVEVVLEAEDENPPLLLFFLSDGDDMGDRARTEALVKSLSYGPVFIVFIALGKDVGKFTLMEKLDNLPSTSRYIDNVRMVKLATPDSKTPEQFVGEVMKELKPWLENEKVKAMLLKK